MTTPEAAVKGPDGADPHPQITSSILYSYKPNRLNKRTSNDNTTGEETVSDLLQKEAKLNDDFSLSLIATDMRAEDETNVRLFVAKKLGKGTVFSGAGNVAQFDLQFEQTNGSGVTVDCYYCLLREQSLDLDFGDDDLADMNKEYVVCFVSTEDHCLDIYRPELDKYCVDMLPLLEENAGSAIEDYLFQWYDSLQYLQRCIVKLKDSLQYLVYNALADVKIVIQGAEEKFKSDIEKFVDCCSLSELMAAPSSAKTSQSDLDSLILDWGESSTNRKTEVVLRVDEGKWKFGSTACTKFCTDVANGLLSGDQNLVYLKQIIENYKLKVIQDMNSLKRLIRQAENDHYALYRALIFLQKNANGPILLNLAKLEYQNDSSQEPRDVLLVLDEYIQETAAKRVQAQQ